MRDIAGSSG